MINRIGCNNIWHNEDETNNDNHLVIKTIIIN